MMMATPTAPAVTMIAPQRLVPSEQAFLRFLSGMRALLAVLGALALFNHEFNGRGLLWSLLLPYLFWSAWLMERTLAGWWRAGSRLWLWVDTAVLLAAAHLAAEAAPLLSLLVVLPVVASAVLAGILPALLLAGASAAVLVTLVQWPAARGGLPALPMSLPLVLLAFGPAAALLARPNRDLRQRLELIETFGAAADPRQGLRQHVDTLMGLLAARFDIHQAVLSVQGPEPRVFLWRPQRGAEVLNGDELEAWRRRLDALPLDAGCVIDGGLDGAPAVAFQLPGGVRTGMDPEAGAALRAIGGPALTLPLMSYGRPHGALCLKRDSVAFDLHDLTWLHETLHELLPLLERSDLLEQLQRETASQERERIGRDLHDSAVQPYLGLKYGLEAIARRATPDNPLAQPLQQLAQMATDELQTLRDVVSGLRQGRDTARQDSASLAALQRQVQRFESLYGLKVHVFAPQAPHLRGSAAKAMLHMVNEALTNVRRHTSATAVTVMLDVQPGEVVMRLRNDHGVGEPLAQDFVPRSLTERAAEFGGRVDVTHESNFTEITVSLPLVGAIG